jgi:RimJ/RimL family protein N-acetyltransferase
MNLLLESSRLLLRRPETGDIPSLERVFCDTGMMRYLGAPWTPEYVIEVFAEWRAEWGVEQRWSGVLIKKDTLEMVGTAGLTRDTIPGEAGFELSWFVLPEHQRQGFAAEITAQLLRFAFTELSAGRVVAETHPENRAAQRVLKNLGGVCLGERRHHYDDLPGFETQTLWEFAPGMLATGGTMDHVVYLDASAKELDGLLSGRKTMIIRGATGRKLPHGRVQAGDVLYFINSNAEGTVRARAAVSKAIHSDKMTEDESRSLVQQHQPRLCLTEKQFARWAGKRYIVLIEVTSVEAIPPFAIDKSAYGNMDDWLAVENIASVRKPA